MRKIARSELLDLEAYEAQREQIRARLIARKQERRLPLGEHMTLLWENRETVYFQVQEMLRAERITAEGAIAHELDTYNELVPDRGQCLATLFIEYADAEQRRAALAALCDLPQHLFLRIGERRICAECLAQEAREAGRFPAVSYLRFQVDDARALMDPSVRVCLELEHPTCCISSELPMPQRSQLATELNEP